LRTLRVAKREIAWMMVGLLVAGALGCTRSDWIQSTLVTVDVSGEWQGNLSKPTASYGPSLIQLKLQQSGPKVTGTFSFSTGPTTSPSRSTPCGTPSPHGRRCGESPCRNSRSYLVISDLKMTMRYAHLAPE